MYYVANKSKFLKRSFLVREAREIFSIPRTLVDAILSPIAKKHELKTSRKQEFETLLMKMIALFILPLVLQ